MSFRFGTKTINFLLLPFTSFKSTIFLFWFQKNVILTLCHLSPPSRVLKTFWFQFWKKYNPYFLLSPFTSLKSIWIFFILIPKINKYNPHFLLSPFISLKSSWHFLLSPFTSLKSTWNFLILVQKKKYNPHFLLSPFTSLKKNNWFQFQT